MLVNLRMALQDKLTKVPLKIDLNGVDAKIDLDVDLVKISIDAVIVCAYYAMNHGATKMSVTASVFPRNFVMNVSNNGSSLDESVFANPQLRFSTLHHIASQYRGTFVIEQGKAIFTLPVNE